MNFEGLDGAGSARDHFAGARGRFPVHIKRHYRCNVIRYLLQAKVRKPLEKIGVQSPMQKPHH
jgi:hypothetical protein